MREFLQLLSLVILVGVVAEDDVAPHFTLKPLPYPMTALSPFISKETMKIHHGAHLKGYVDQANLLTQNRTDVHGMSVSELIEHEAPGPLFNQVAQIWNHLFFFQCMTPPHESLSGCTTSDDDSSDDDVCRQPHPLRGHDFPDVPSPLKEAMESQYGSVKSFVETFSLSAKKHFGSGWVWLVLKTDGKSLEVYDTDNAMNPVKDMSGHPLLGLDVWEHAYYIDRRNQRPKYIEAFWEVVNWPFVNDNYQRALRGDAVVFT